MAVSVRRASHVHQTPQVDLPQMDPEARMTPVNTTPTSAEATATASARRSRFHRYSTLARSVTKNAKYAVATARGGGT